MDEEAQGAASRGMSVLFFNPRLFRFNAACCSVGTWVLSLRRWRAARASDALPLLRKGNLDCQTISDSSIFSTRTWLSSICGWSTVIAAGDEHDSPLVPARMALPSLIIVCWRAGAWQYHDRIRGLWQMSVEGRKPGLKRQRVCDYEQR